MVDQLNAFASEVSRVAREVGTEGKLGGQAQVPGVSGTWKDLTDNVNAMAANLTNQVRNIAEVTTAVARGNLSKKITVDVKGEILELKSTINTMVDQLNAFASEVSRVAREVGTEGKLGGQAQVPGVAGTWKDLTDNVNAMAANLTNQVRNIAEVTTAVARGDLSKKITVDVKGEILELKSTVNTMVDQLDAFAAEVTQVAREVGTEGKLGGQAQVRGRRRHLEGPHRQRQPSWRANLTDQVRGIAQVVTAVAKGDLRRKAGARGQGGDRCVRGDDQRHDRHARDVCRPGDRPSRARSASKGSSADRPKCPARRDVAGPGRQRQPAGGEPYDPGSRHCGRGDGGHQRAICRARSCRSARRGGGPQGQHQ